MNATPSILVLAAYVIFGTFGCATSIATDSLEFRRPVPVTEQQFDEVGFAGLLSSISPGTTIGAHHDGIAQIPHFSYRWGENYWIRPDDGFGAKATTLLRRAGYRALGDPESVFEPDSERKARVQLAAKVTGVAHNTFAPLAGGFGELLLTIEWQLYDTVDRSLRLKETTTGYAKSKFGSSGLVLDAFGVALNNLLARPTFAAAMRRRNTTDESIWSRTAQTISIRKCPANPSTELPRDFDIAMRAVVRIQCGLLTGSGAVVSPDGFVLTVAHLVSGAMRCQVYFRSGLSLEAEVLRADPPQDVAVIRIPGSGHACLPCDASPPELGVEIYAIGNPLTYEFSVTKGVVSATRTVDGREFVQTDASVNEGSSGGPIVDHRGHMRAIVSWKRVDPTAEGLSFASTIEAAFHRLGLTWGEEPQ